MKLCVGVALVISLAGSSLGFLVFGIGSAGRQPDQ